MSVPLPDPAVQARAEAERINSNREQFLTGPVERVIADSPHADPESLLSGLEDFYRASMECTPSAQQYPEAAPWVDYVRAADRQLKELATLSERELAVVRSLGIYLTFRGHLRARPCVRERCRVAFIPETDRGPMHIKNIDDPLRFWHPDPNPPAWRPMRDGLVSDGVGSGLHIDDEPDELFPLPAQQMCMAHCHDVPSAVEFLTRYSKFWGGCNYLLHDGEQRSVAIEKASHNFIETYGPDACGGSHISGMTCRDPASPQGRYQAQKRRQYTDKYGQTDEGFEHVYWRGCAQLEEMLAGLMAQPRLKVSEVLNLFTTVWPDGLNRDGTKCHPEQPYSGYTLITHAFLPAEGVIYRWQRSAEGAYATEPEVHRF